MERLTMRTIQEILFRLKAGQSERAIARDLDLSRDAVHRYRDLADRHGFLDLDRPLPEPAVLLAAFGEAVPPPRFPSTVEPFRPLVLDWLDRGVERKAIHQKLVDRHGFTGSYSAVLRFVGQLRPTHPEVFVRIETPPGAQAQIDFGTMGRLFDFQAGRLRTVYAFVMTLAYSRHQYLEFVFDQTIPTWIGCHRRAFESFGGVPHQLVVDNLKAAVLKAALGDTVLSTPYSKLGHHYGCLIHPCRPRTPEHKGKVENGVHYVERNFWAGETFLDLDDANRRGRRWVEEVAGVRDHGTTHQPPLARFFEHEQAHLLPLAPEPFRLLEVRNATVHRDCHVTVEGRYYSAPHTHVGRTVEVHLSEALVEIYDGVTLLRTHSPAKERGERVTRLEDYPPEKALYLERTPEVCRERAERVGPACVAIVEGLLSERPLDQRVAVQKLVGLEERYGAERLEAARARALHYGDPRYRRVKQILGAGLEHAPLTEASALLSMEDTVIETRSEAPASLPSQTDSASPSAPEIAAPRPPTERAYRHARNVQEFFPQELFAPEGPQESRPC